MNGEKVPSNWVYGGIFQGTGDFSVIYGADKENFTGADLGKHTVYTDTVGQYTGLTDKNGKKIFEGDIHEIENFFFVVKYGKYRDYETGKDGYGWYFEYIHRKGCEGFDGTENEYVNIIGNIHDNPELLEDYE
jgi:uncharacterized phage protein (TIGR01671 family)